MWASPEWAAHLTCVAFIPGVVVRVNLYLCMFVDYVCNCVHVCGCVSV